MYRYNSGNRPINTNSAVFYLIAVNIAFFTATNVLPFIFPYGGGLLAMHYPSSDYFRPWQIITHMFMHANFGHIAFNMLGLYMFGEILERVWGTKRFAEFYILTGLGAVLLHTLIQGIEIFNMTGSFAPAGLLQIADPRVATAVNVPLVGASGAVFGLLTAFALLFPNTELFLMFVPIPVKAKYAIGVYVIYELISGVSNNPADHVAHFAHLGGALMGFIIIRIWSRNRNVLY